ncbi:DUF7619 domain-containing protein [Flavobacterium sp. SM2513]|uniref:DUF7619 domain-containing protein n=1 Tax=Flavobacterium sp. SM2513 TaxID=3424766 RepID=UPI003D7FBBA5
MKKTLLLILTTFYCLLGYAQFPQDFENTAITVPNGFPAGWLVTDNGVGTAANWSITNSPSVVINGTKSALMNRHEIGAGNTSEDWLISPVTLIPSNGQLKFNTKQTLPGDDGTLYQIRIYSGNSQNALSSYSILQQWTESQLNVVYNVAEEKVVNFPTALFGTSQYIAFVRIYTQPTAVQGGDRWLIDDINVTAQCLNPFSISTASITSTSANLFWSNGAGSNNNEVELILANETAAGIATHTTETNSLLVTGLTPGACYKFYVRTNCGNGNFSTWTGPYNFCTYQTGSECANPIVVSNLPYQTTDFTGNYANNLPGPQVSSCISGTTNYQSGKDVFYSYTATESTMLSFTLDPTQTKSSLFIYPSCSGTTGPCLAAMGNTNANPRIIDYYVTAGTTYIVVISSNLTSIAYDLTIKEEPCAPKPTNLTVSNATATGADLAWNVPTETVLGYEIAVQSQGSSMPTGPGQYTSATPTLAVNDLNGGTGYQYWVRSECTSGVFSSWVGPVTFSTLLCNPANQCTYTFRMTDTANNGWNGARMQIRQNGAVLQTIGETYNAGAGPVDIAVSLCNNEPFDVYWSIAGSQPLQCDLSVINSFGQTIATINGNAVLPYTSIYNGVMDCNVAACNLAPNNVTASAITFSGATINWDATATENQGFDVYIVASGAPQPTASTMPTYSGMTGSSAPFSYSIPDGTLLSDTFYDVYVRVQCEPNDSPWSGVQTFKTEISCPQPIDQTVTGIGMNSAVLGWSEAASATQWEVLVLAATNGVEPAAPLANPIAGINDIFIQNLTGATTTTPTLQPATIYYYYVRSVCQPEIDKSAWTGPFIFNTTVCNTADTCTYKFLLTNASNNNWNSGRMQVRQNGIVVATLGTGGINNANGIAVAICNNVPFDLYWNQAGDLPQEIGVSIIDANNDIIFTKLAGQGTPLTILYSDTDLGNCAPPTCPKPSNLLATASQTTAQLSWTETGSATQWEVYVAEAGMPQPVNGTPLNTGVVGFYLATSNTNFTVNGLTSSTNYTYYVRAICSSTDIGNWTILNPISFITKPSNDECATSINVPVNPTPDMTQTVAGTTLGGTASSEISTCPGNENDDVWFNFMATNTIHIVNLLNTAGTTTSLRFAVYSGADCATTTEIYCSPTNLGGNLIGGLTVGQTYKIRIYTNGNNPTQFATFEVGITTPLPITNDECVTAIPLPVNEGLDCIQVTSGSITGATASPELITCSSSIDDDVWFSFVATSQSHVVTISDIVGTATDLNSALYSGNDCGNLTFISCNNNDQTVINNLVIGTTYTIRVWSATAILVDIQFNICIASITPPIIANTTQYTVPQLVNDVLINSPCSTIANITWATGTTEATNGIGYFNKGNSVFPFQQGIILSTGSAAAVVGPNTSILSGGGAGGDADLSAILANQVPPVTGALNNATKLEFDFVAVTDQINFNFLFASDEYGVFQCQYSDAFAFILTDLTAGTLPTNLAVLPGTNVPVSILNIRDTLYNTNCPSNNLAYFGSYYSNPAGVLGAPVNFNGITVPMTAGATVIPGNSYHIKMVIADYLDAAYDSAVFLEGGSFNPGEDNCTDKIKLIAFHDTNSNGIKEETETSFTYGLFKYQLNDTAEIHNLSSPIGAYTIFDQNPLNSYDFTFDIHPEYATYFSAGTTAYTNITIPAGSGTQTLYFPIAQIQGYNDATISISPIGQPVAGFDYNNKIVYQNLGTAPTSGTINYTKDPAVTVSSLESGVTINPTGFSYDFVNLAPFESRSFNIKMSVPSIPVVNIDDVLSSSVAISAPANDINTNNNSFSILQTVVASYDPNDKMEAHGTKLNFETFTQNDYLFYTIRFQNTGTTNAINIRIEDVLDAQLDSESVRMVSASHNYLLERVGNQLVWKFNSINLPSVIQNEELSNGYLTFKVKVQPGFAVGDVIPNFAEIYFDTNPAIITNTFQSTFMESLSIKGFTSTNILLYPNPTNAMLHINLQNTNESLKNIIVYDMIGKTIKTISGNNAQQASINVGNLAKGVYMIEITTDSNLKQVRKFIVN